MIYIQVNWIMTMLANKQEEFAQKVIKSIGSVGTQLKDERGTTQAGKHCG